LTAQQVEWLRSKLKATPGKTVDQVLDSLEAALSQLPKTPGKPGSDDSKSATSTDPSGDPTGAKPPPAPAPSTAPPAPQAPSAPANQPAPGPDATLTTEPTGRGAQVDREAVIKQLAQRAAKHSFQGVAPGQYRITWEVAEKGGPQVHSTISGTLAGKLLDKTPYLRTVEAEVTAVDGRKLQIKFITATPMVTAKGRIVYTADHFLSRKPEWVMLDSPKRRR
jgi:hypothetical protein